jgi:hypothetical protein
MAGIFCQHLPALAILPRHCKAIMDFTADI